MVNQDANPNVDTAIKDIHTREVANPVQQLTRPATTVELLGTLQTCVARTSRNQTPEVTTEVEVEVRTIIVDAENLTVDTRYIT